MTERTCRYCGEAGHNVRSCKEKARTTDLAAQILPRLLRDLPTAIKKAAPIHSLDASMIECEVTPRPGDIKLSWNQSSDLQNLIVDKINKHSEFQFVDANLLKEHMSIKIKEGRNQVLSFFVTGEVPNENHYYFRLQKAIGFLELDFSGFVQSMLETNSDNQYKKIWKEVVEPTMKNGNYSNYEGKEGALVIAFLRSYIRNVQNSAMNKRNNSGSEFFSSVVSAIHLDSSNKQSAYKNVEHTSYEGEWYNDQSPDIEISWVDDERLNRNLSFKLTQALTSEIETSVKEYAQEILFSHAKSVALRAGSKGYSISTISHLIDFMIPNYNKLDGVNNTAEVNSPYFSTVTVGGSLFYQEGTPMKATTDIMEKCTALLQPRKTRDLASDFIKMAHSGGYAQTFEKGKMLNNSGGSASIARTLDVRQKKWNGEPEAVTYIPFYPGTNCAISISDIVNSILEIYAFAEMSSKENQ